MLANHEIGFEKKKFLNFYNLFQICIGRYPRNAQSQNANPSSGKIKPEEKSFI